MGLTKRQKQSRAAAASRWEPSQAESDDDTISESSLMSDEFEMLDEDPEEDAESMKSFWARFMKAFASTFPLKDRKRPLGRAGDGPSSSCSSSIAASTPSNAAGPTPSTSCAPSASIQ